MINNKIAWWTSVQIYHEPENRYFSYIIFEHGYLTYYSTDLFDILYVYCWDMYEGKILIWGLVFVLCYVKEGTLRKSTKNHKSYPFFTIK